MSVPFGNSAFTLQRQSPTRWSFSKDDRFKSPKSMNASEFIVFPSTLSPRSTSIGFGSRYELKNPSGKDVPAPGAYDLPTSFDSIKGPKIVKHSALPLIPNRFISPGPGAYDPRDTGRNSPKYTMRQRRIANYHKKNFNGPSPGSYNPRFTLTEFSAYKDIKFGPDIRKIPDKVPDTGPGPGHYYV